MFYVMDVLLHASKIAIDASIASRNSFTFAVHVATSGIIMANGMKFSCIKMVSGVCCRHEGYHLFKFLVVDVRGVIILWYACDCFMWI
jgi:hypothetical protein